MAEHISSQFNQELETVRTMVMKMGGLVEQQLQNVIKGLEGNNSGLLQVGLSAKTKLVLCLEVWFLKDTFG